MKTDNKLIPYLFNLLEKTNKKFTEKWKFCQTSNQTCSFKECSESYQMIIELVRDNQREDTKQTFLKLNSLIKNHIRKRNDIQVLFVNYNEMIENPSDEISKILEFLHEIHADKNAMLRTIDKKLYRHRDS